MREITLKELLEAGCHFGHQVPKGNPKAREFVYTNRDKIQIIDLVKTKKGLEEAAAFVKTTAANGGKIIFVGTKKQARKIIEEEAKRCGAFYISERWIGGFLTNWPEVRKNLKAMADLRQELQSEKWTKKEKLLMERRLKKLEFFYGGVEGLNEAQPDALFIVDIYKEKSAVKEANKVGVPIVGIVDTNANPELATWSIPANDDAVGSIKLIASFLADAVLEGRQLFEKKVEPEEKESKEEKKEKKTREKTTATKTKKEIKVQKSKKE